MHLDGARADAERFGHFLGRQPLRDAFRDFAFAIGEDREHAPGASGDLGGFRAERNTLFKRFEAAPEFNPVGGPLDVADAGAVGEFEDAAHLRGAAVGHQGKTFEFTVEHIGRGFDLIAIVADEDPGILGTLCAELFHAVEGDYVTLAGEIVSELIATRKVAVHHDELSVLHVFDPVFYATMNFPFIMINYV